MAVCIKNAWCKNLEFRTVLNVNSGARRAAGYGHHWSRADVA
jgi:hypothetical protein